ncbi:MAG: amidohydrolase [Pseudomonadota bacterium]
MTYRLLVCLVLVVATHTSAAATLMYNVHGYTMSGGQRHEFVALEYENGVITSVYENTQSVAASTATIRIDGNGATLLPGLIDAHGHIPMLGEALANVDLTGSSSEAEAARRVAARAAQVLGDGWLIGSGWNQVSWPGGAFPTRASLDARVPDRPVLLHRVDVHAIWVNSRALELAGIDAATPDPEGGVILRDENGEPTGVLVDNAKNLVEAARPAKTLAEHRADILRATRHLLSLGMTGAHDAGVSDMQMQAYESLLADDALPMRVYAMLATTDKANAQRLQAGPREYPGGRFTARSVKVFADGALGSRGAALIDDYSDAPGNRGLLLQSDDALHETMHGAADAGFQVNVHAIGDLANRRVLDEFALINANPKKRALRHRVEHAQVLTLVDLVRFRSLDVIASMQPTHATSDKNMAGDRLGEARLAGAYAWQRVLKSGARMAGGSDFPVEPPNPLYGLHAAVTREDREGDPPGGWRVDEALSREQALSLFTEDAAYAGHVEDQVGRLEPGYAADFILIDRDYFDVPAADIWKLKVLKTFVDGEMVFDAQ